MRICVKRKHVKLIGKHWSHVATVIYLALYLLALQYFFVTALWIFMLVLGTYTWLHQTYTLFNVHAKVEYLSINIK